MSANEHKTKLIKLPTKHIKNKDILHEVKWFNRIGFVLPVNKKGISTFYAESLKTVYRTQGQVWEYFNDLDPHLKCIALYALTNWGLLFNKNVKLQTQMLLVGKGIVKKAQRARRSSTVFFKQYKGSLNLLQSDNLCKIILPNGAGLLVNNKKHELFNGTNILSNTYFNVNGILGNPNTSVAFFKNYTLFTLRENGIIYSLYNGINDNADIYTLKVKGEGEVCINSKLQTYLNIDTCNVKVNSVAGKFTYYAFSDNIKMQYSNNVCKGGNLELYASSNVLLKKNEEIIIHFCISFNHKKPSVNFTNTVVNKTYCVSVVQRLLANANISSNLPLNTLKTKIKAFNDLVKTSFLPTTVLDDLNNLESLIPFGIKFNVILLDKTELASVIKPLVESGVFIYQFNRNEINPDALHYLNLLSNSKLPNTKSKIPYCVEIKTEVNKVLPKTHTTTLTNQNKKIQKCLLVNTYQTNSQNAASILPLGKLVEKQGNTITIMSLLTGKTSVIKANVPCIIGEGRSFYATAINTQTPIRLCGYEQQIIKHKFISNSQISAAAKKLFLAELSNIKLQSENTILNELFTKPITQIENTQINKDLLKNKSLFNALLKSLQEIPSNVYTLILEKVIGIKTIKGRIELNPLTALTGSFILSFESAGEPYTFKVNVNDNKFSVDYNNVNYRGVTTFKLG